MTYRILRIDGHDSDHGAEGDRHVREDPALRTDGRRQSERDETKRCDPGHQQETLENRRDERDRFVSRPVCQSAGAPDVRQNHGSSECPRDEKIRPQQQDRETGEFEHDQSDEGKMLRRVPAARIGAKAKGHRPTGPHVDHATYVTVVRERTLSGREIFVPNEVTRADARAFRGRPRDNRHHSCRVRQVRSDVVRLDPFGREQPAPIEGRADRQDDAKREDQRDDYAPHEAFHAPRFRRYVGCPPFTPRVVLLARCRLVAVPSRLFESRACRGASFMDRPSERRGVPQRVARLAVRAAP